MWYASREMEYRDKRNKWLQEVEAARRDVVFPQASKEEVESCRNYKKQPPPLVARIFYACSVVFVLVFILVVAYKLHREGELLSVAVILGLTGLLFLGPLYALLAWSAHRSLRQIRDLKRNRKIRPHQY